MGYAARPETLLTPEYGCCGSQRVNSKSKIFKLFIIFEYHILITILILLVYFIRILILLVINIQNYNSKRQRKIQYNNASSHFFYI